MADVMNPTRRNFLAMGAAAVAAPAIPFNPVANVGALPSNAMGFEAFGLPPVPMGLEYFYNKADQTWWAITKLGPSPVVEELYLD